MALTSIGQQKTPGRPTEVTFAAETGLPSDTQELLLIGHRGASGSSGTATTYQVTAVNNVADSDLAKTEAETKFGVGSELAKMVVAAVKANAGGGTFPAIKCIPLANSDTGFGPSDEALTAAKKVKAEYVVSPYDAFNESALLDDLEEACQTMSGAQRVHNNQFGTVGVAANFDEADPGNLNSPDSQYLSLAYLRDQGNVTANPYSLGELASAYAAVLAANVVPFNPVDDVVIGSVPAPADPADILTIGAGLESETVLDKGWTPLKVKPNGDVAIVRSVTTRITTNGTTEATSYIDVQDFNVLYFWRKTIVTRFSQPDFTQVKASEEKAKKIKSEAIRLAGEFEAQGMFQAVAELAPFFVVERNASDRSRFDLKTPVNVVPGLHVVATNIEATTQFDTITV